MKYFKIYSKNTLVYNVLLVLLSLVLGLVTMKLAPITKEIYDVGILQNNNEVFINSIITFTILMLIIFCINFVSNIIGYKIHWDGMKNIKMALFKKVLSSDYKIFTENTSAAMWNDINLLSFQVGKFYKSFIVFCGKTIECILLTYLAFKINYVVALVLLVLLSLVSILNMWVNKKVGVIQRKLIQLSRDSATLGLDIISSVDNIKAKNLYDFFLEKTNNSMKEIHHYSTANSLLLCYWDSIISLITNISMMIIIYCMIFVFNISNIQIGDIIIIYTIIPLMARAYKIVFSYVIEVSTVKPAMKKMDIMLNYEEDTLGNQELTEFKTIEFNDVRVKYANDKEVVIPNVTINNGDKILVAGESGLGKSTMFDIMLGINKKYEGTVTVNGVNIKNFSVKSLRKVFGISFQENSVFNMSIEDNIKLGRDAHIDYNNIIDICLLNKQVNEKKSEMINNKKVSGGEKSRISIAQNLFSNPNVILIDEALSSVDASIEEGIMSNLLKKFKDKTIICISHRKSSQEYFDKVIQF